jgi:hypothetical protein
VVFLKLSRNMAPAASVALTVMLGLAPAQASSTPGWRVVQTFKATSETDTIAADSAGDAWAAGSICKGQCKVNHLLVSHWDGSAWQRVTVPSTKVASSSEAAIVGASSASNAWVFAKVGLGPRTEALHWNGTVWDSVTKFPAFSAIQATACRCRASTGTRPSRSGCPGYRAADRSGRRALPAATRAMSAA